MVQCSHAPAQFQSTPPARGATTPTCTAIWPTTFQSTPPARGATPVRCHQEVDRHISIHAPREGGDYLYVYLPRTPQTFQSTPPARGATSSLQSRCQPIHISIHAPREGGDHGVLFFMFPRLHISIHAPREGGDSPSVSNAPPPMQFQSTPPARGATAKQHSCIASFGFISIHAPREGGD